MHGKVKKCGFHKACYDVKMFHFNFCNLKNCVCKIYTHSVLTFHCVVYSVCPLGHVTSY